MLLVFDNPDHRNYSIPLTSDLEKKFLKERFCTV